MKNEKIAVLDLGSYKIKLLIISLNKDNYIDVHAKYSVFSSGIKKGNVVDVEKLSSTIKNSINSIEKETKTKIKEVYVGINSTHFNFLSFGVSRDIGSYEIEQKKDIQNLINTALRIFYEHYPNYKIIHFLNSGIYLDKKNFVENPNGLRSKTLDMTFSFLSLEKNTFLNFENAISRAGLKVKKYFYSPLAVSILSSDKDSLNRGFVNIDLGFDKTCISFFENSKLLYSKILPIGSHHINNDLIKAIDLEKNLAEKIKCSFDSILNNNIDPALYYEINKKYISIEIIVKVIEARINEIVDYIYKSVLFSKSLNKSSKKIILTGGGSNLKYLSRILADRLNSKIDFAKQTFPIKDTEFNVFSDYMVCLGIAKLIYFPNYDEIKSFSDKPSGFFNKFYSLFMK